MEKLGRKKKKEILKGLEEYGINIKENLIYLTKDSVYLLTPEAFELIKRIKKEGIKFRAGFYLAKIEKQGLRLSFDSCQLFSKQIKKYIEINSEKAEKWFRGEDVNINNKQEGFFVLKYKEDFVGCGFVKNGIIKNYIPKDRRIKSFKNEC